MNLYNITFKRCMMLLFIYFSGLCKLSLAGDKILLRDVEVLTLYNGKMTNGRRSSPVPQLKCTGGSASCSFVPNAVQCYNRGSDGYDIQWECKTDMDNKYKFGNIQVNCEGYDYPEDPYILRGSCGLEYTIELTEEGRDQRGHDDRNYHHHDDNGYNKHQRRSSNSNYGIGDLVMVVIVGIIVYMIYSTYTANRARNDTTVPPTVIPPTAPPPYPEQPGFRSAYTAPGSDTPPPPYTAEEPGFKREYTQQQGTGAPTGSTTSDSSNNYGFWSGAAGGGLLGYLFGSRNTGSRYTPQNRGWGGYNNSYYPRNGGGSGWFGSNWFGGGGRSYNSRPSSNFGYPSSGSSSRSSSSGSRTASGMGGTSRR